MQQSDLRILLADLVAEIEAHGRSLEELKRALTRLSLSDDQCAALERRERAVEADYLRMRQRLIALKARFSEVRGE